MRGIEHLKLIAKTVSGSITGFVSPLPGEGDATRVKVLANRGDAANEVSTFAEPDGSFELVPMREGTHAISAEWITVVDEEATACRVHEHGPVDVIAEQTTNIARPITLVEGDPDC